MKGQPRSAYVVGFTAGLQSAIGDLLGRHGFSVTPVHDAAAAARKAAARPPHLIVVTGRCGVEAILSLIHALPARRATRVVVLLPGPDVEAERRYRAAGVRVVLRMPVGAEDLMRAGLAPWRQQREPG